MAKTRGYTFEIKKADNHQYYWHLIASNGDKIAWSGETYVEKAKCLHGMNLAIEHASKAGIVDYSDGEALVLKLAAIEDQEGKKAG